jgi:hypothetical protein
MPDSSTQRVRRHRGHKVGDHELCRWQTCRVRSQIEDEYRTHFDAKVMFEEIAKADLDAKQVFGQDYRTMREMADRNDWPDWMADWAAAEGWAEISETDRIIARSHIKMWSLY